MEEEIPNQQEFQQEQIISFINRKSKNQKSILAYPWNSSSKLTRPDPILRLHNQIIDFYLYITPKGTNITLFDRITAIAQQYGTVLSPFYSHQVYLKDTQIELYLLISELDKSKAQEIVEILKQKLPNSLTAQISCNEYYQTYEFQLEQRNQKAIIRIVDKNQWTDYLTLAEESLSNIIQLKYLYIVFSCMIRQRWMHLSIKPILIFGLLSVFFYERRKQRSRTLSENILKFLEYYGMGPFQERRINYLGKGRYQLVPEVASQDPFSFWINNRVNISTPLLREFFNLLKNRYRLISNFNFDQQQSILRYLVNPCSKQFEYL